MSENTYLALDLLEDLVCVIILEVLVVVALVIVTAELFPVILDNVFN